MLDENLLLEIVDNQHWSFPLAHPLVLDSKLAGDKIQCYLRLCQYINQDGKCLCGKELDNWSELHHALISRNDAVNLPEPEIIHSSYNTVLMHVNCHKRIRRSLCLIYLSQIFNIKDISQWYMDVKSQMVGGFRSVEAILDDELLPER